MGEKIKVIVNPNGGLEKVDKDGKLVSFDSEFSQEKTAALERFEATLPKDFNSRVDAAIKANTRDRVDPARVYRNILEKELGNKAFTDIGKAFIEAKVRDRFGIGR